MGSSGNFLNSGFKNGWNEHSNVFFFQTKEKKKDQYPSWWFQWSLKYECNAWICFK